MCTQLGVSRSAYYEWRKNGGFKQDLNDAPVKTLIAHFHEDLDRNPGVRRIRAELAAHGRRVSHKRVHRLMQALGLQGRHPRAMRRTTIAGKPANAPDLIERNFTADAPNEKWCGDITYIKTVDGWAYLATVIDLYSRKVVGWAVDNHMRTSLVTKALDMALTHRKPTGAVIFHTDRGSQYTSTEHVAHCARNNVTRSLGRTGICYDNAVAESFFATYKKELVHRRAWNSAEDLHAATFEWIETYYNRRRRHSTLGYLTPHEYEQGIRNIHELAA